VPADSVIPLATAAQFTEGAFKDLATAVEPGTLADMLGEATRLCEEQCGRRLAPFTITEMHRATGIDPDEYADSANLPMDIQGTLGASYASALSVSPLVRHAWVQECAPFYQDMWTYSDVSVTIIRSYGGTQQLGAANILGGPEPDTGHLWFQLGMFIPVGSRIQVTYSGGYTTVPASLVRAAKYMTASIICRELNPDDNAHDPDLLREDAAAILAYWQRA
jgi:hypothetical protein